MEILSPIHQIQLPSKAQIWVKRDDLIDPFISGNKWRKLKYILKAAAEQQKSHLVTFGGAFSNHLVATAAAAARNNLRSTAFVRGENVTNEMLLICKLFGMNLIFTDRESYRDKRNIFNQHFGNDNNAFFIDEGGASEEAVKGCAEIIEELPQNFDHIFCAAGTGTTAAGLLKGLINKNTSTQLHVIPVLKGGSFIEAEVAKYELDLNRLIIHTEYHFGGYAKTTPELIDFIKEFTTSTGMLIDPVYTGKLFYAINDLTNKGYFKKEDKILAIHTGGLLGMFGMKEKFSGILR
jgi:1-aminocyclopropane-1-carboxylate deaminase